MIPESTRDVKMINMAVKSFNLIDELNGSFNTAKEAMSKLEVKKKNKTQHFSNQNVMYREMLIK